MVQPRKADMWNRLKASKLNNEKQYVIPCHLGSYELIAYILGVQSSFLV
jgi:hypothetical protein